MASAVWLSNTGYRGPRPTSPPAPMIVAGGLQPSSKWYVNPMSPTIMIAAPPFFFPGFARPFADARSRLMT
jgi:hypothetical protein